MAMLNNQRVYIYIIHTHRLKTDKIWQGNLQTFRRNFRGIKDILPKLMRHLNVTKTDHGKLGNSRTKWTFILSFLGITIMSHLFILCLYYRESPLSINGYGYGSIPINTIFSGMNIHLPAILMFTRGTRFWHTAISMSQDSIGADRATRNPNETAKTLEAPIYAESVAGDLSWGVMVAATWSGIF